MLGVQHLGGQHKIALPLGSRHGGLKLEKPDIELMVRNALETHLKITDVVRLPVPQCCEGG
jgi:hypothetical protein